MLDDNRRILTRVDTKTGNITALHQPPLVTQATALTVTPDASAPPGARLLDEPYLSRAGLLMMDPRADGDLTVDRYGFTDLVAERRYAHGACLVPVRPSSRPLHFLPLTGQSNAINGGGSDSRRLVDAYFPAHGLTFARQGKRVAGTPGGTNTNPPGGDPAEEVDSASLDGFTPMMDGPSTLGQGANSLWSLAIELAYRRQGSVSDGTAVYRSGRGASGLDVMTKPIVVNQQPRYPATDPNIYENIIHVATRLRDLVTLYNRQAVCHLVMLVQGEGGVTASANATWEQVAIKLANDYRVDLQSALGQDPGVVIKMMVAQTTTQDAYAPQNGVVDPIPIEQVKACRDNPDLLVLAAPMYHNFMNERGVHGSTASKSMIWEAFGHAYWCYVTTGSWQCLQADVASITRNGAVIDIPYLMQNSYQDLEFDPGVDFPEKDGWIKPVPNYGFHYSDDTGSISIQSVEIVENTQGSTRFLQTVRITLTGVPDPADTKKLTYARHVFDSTEDRWSSTRGQLRMSIGRSFMRDFGLPIPRDAYVYAVAEEFDIL